MLSKSPPEEEVSLDAIAVYIVDIEYAGEAESVPIQPGDHLGGERLAFVQRPEGYLAVHVADMWKEAGRTRDYLTLVPLNIDLEERGADNVARRNRLVETSASHLCRPDRSRTVDF